MRCDARALLGAVCLDALERCLDVDEPLRLLCVRRLERVESGELLEQQTALDVGVHDVAHRRPAELLVVELHLLRDVVHRELGRDVAHCAARDSA